MKTLATLLPEIEYGDKSQLTEHLFLLSEKINKIFLKIQSCENYKSAEDYFALLGQIQSILAKLVFKDEIEISDRLFQFVRDFDRIDDEFTQEYLFNEIKNGQYLQELK